jgi:hypothetical protein
MVEHARFNLFCVGPLDAGSKRPNSAVADRSDARLVRSFFVRQAQFVPSDGSALPVSSATFANWFRNSGMTPPNESG